eukprot:2441031-Pleurochrysis_carterae.AAC.1
MAFQRLISKYQPLIRTTTWPYHPVALRTLRLGLDDEAIKNTQTLAEQVDVASMKQVGCFQLSCTYHFGRRDGWRNQFPVHSTNLCECGRPDQQQQMNAPSERTSSHRVMWCVWP